MEIRSHDYIQQQTKNISGKKYRKSIIQIQKILQKTQLYQCSFIYELLILQQKALVKLLNKNIFKKQPYSLHKAKYIINLVNRNNSVLLYIVSKSIEQESNFTLKQTPDIFEIRNPKADQIIQKIIDCKNLRFPIELFFENFLLISVASINTLKRYDAYQQAYQTSKFCYQISRTWRFPDNLTIQKRTIEIKMIYGAILFELGEYEAVKIIQDQVIDKIINILCSDIYVRYKQNEKKKLVGQNLWRKLLVSIMVNLSSSIHSRNYHNICELYKLFASAVRDSSRSESMTFRKCITYVLDSIGVIVHEYNDVMDEVKDIMKCLFERIEARAQEKYQQFGNKNAFNWKEIEDDYFDQDEEEISERDVKTVLNKSKSHYIPKELSFDKNNESKSDPLNTSGSKQRIKILKSFIEKDSSFNVPSTWKNNDFFKNKDTALNYLSSVSLHNKPNKDKNARKLNRKGQFIKSEIKILDELKERQNNKQKQAKKQLEKEKERQNSRKKQNLDYSKIIKRQFQLKYRQSQMIQNNEDEFLNIPEMKRNIKETDKFIEYSLADRNVPNQFNSSYYFDNEQDCKQQGVLLFVKTILHHKQFLGIPKLFQKHEMIKKKLENINKKKMEKKHKSMSSRRTSKFQNAQLSNLLRSSFTNYVSNPRSRRPRNVRESVGVIVNNKIPESRSANRRPVTHFAKQNQDADKVQKLIDHCYSKSQQIIKKFSSEIESEIRQDETPKPKPFVAPQKSEWGLSQKFYKLGKTIMNNTYSLQQK